MQVLKPHDRRVYVLKSCVGVLRAPLFIVNWKFVQKGGILYAKWFISYDKEKLATRMLPNKNNRSRLLSNKKNIDKLKKIIWSIWPISLRREGVLNDYEQFKALNIPYENISVPTLIIHGDEDKNVDIEHAEYAKEKIEGSILYTVSEGDHMMHATHSEEIETQIEGFILKEPKD